MLDIKFIRENAELVREGAKKKHIDFDLDALLAEDDKRLAVQRNVEEKRAYQNKVSDEIGLTTDQEKRRALIGQMTETKRDLALLEAEQKEIMYRWRDLMVRVPNIPDMSVPEGKGEDDNIEILTWGNKPKFDFPPKDHLELMSTLKMVDFERGIKVHGFRGYFLQGDGAELSWALWNYARHFFGTKNFNTFIAPAIVRKQHLYGTGHLPSGAEDIFKTQDEDYLSGTAEIPMMGYHSEEIIAKEDLPKRYLAFSPCYRREAGSYSKDVKGLIRVHEFFKLEQLILCEANHEQSVKYHEELNRNTEEFIESLGIPYQQLEICTGDLKTAHVKSYDTELWVPKEGKYREIGSASYYHDFQTRRFNTRYRDDDGILKYTHSLNATAIPTPRILVSLVENFQTADGSVKIPEILTPYMNGLGKIKKV